MGRLNLSLTSAKHLVSKGIMKVLIFLVLTLGLFCYGQNEEKEPATGPSENSGTSGMIRAQLRQFIMSKMGKYITHDKKRGHCELHLPNNILNVVGDKPTGTLKIDYAWTTAGTKDTMNWLFTKTGKKVTIKADIDITMSNKGEEIAEQFAFGHYTVDKTATVTWSNDLSGEYSSNVVATFDEWSMTTIYSIDVTSEAVRTNTIFTFNIKTDLSSDLPEGLRFFEGTTHKADLTAQVSLANVCRAGSYIFTKGCKITSTVEGTENGKKKDISLLLETTGMHVEFSGENTVSGESFKFEVTGEDYKEATTLDKSMFFSLDVKTLKMTESALFLRVPSKKVAVRVLRPLGLILWHPHKMLFKKIFEGGNPNFNKTKRVFDQIAVIGLHWDSLARQCIGTTIFDVYRIMKASRIESEMAMTKLKAPESKAKFVLAMLFVNLDAAKTFNELLVSGAHGINFHIINLLNGYVAPKIAATRGYLSRMTGRRGVRIYNRRMLNINNMIKGYTLKNEISIKVFKERAALKNEISIKLFKKRAAYRQRRKLQLARKLARKNRLRNRKN